MVNSQPTQGASAVDGGTRAPEKFSCPFRYRATKHNLSYPDSEPCKEGKQFPNISKLRFVQIPSLENLIFQLERPSPQKPPVAPSLTPP